MELIEISEFSLLEQDLFQFKQPFQKLELNSQLHCEACNSSFPTSQQLRDHIVDELAIQPELIEFFELGIGLDSYSDLPVSSSVKSESSDYEQNRLPCPKCKKSCKGLKGLQQHIAKIHLVRKRPVNCEQCEKSFKHKHALKFHVRQVHEKATRVDCEICGKQIYNKYMLRRHIEAIHTPN